MGAEQLFDVTDDNYEFTGNDDLRKVAEEELRETEAVRSSALHQFRECIKKHPDIKKCRTDSAFLLRFLRTKKFSVPLALEMLEKYLATRQVYPQWFRNFNIDDKVFNEIMDSGYLVPLPVKDGHGRRVLLSCVGRFDPTKYTSTDMIRAHSLVAEHMMEDEENQIRGYTYLNDESGLTMSHISSWSVNDISCILKCIQNSTPMRHKLTYFVNIPSACTKVYDFLLGFIGEKLKTRLRLISTVDELRELVGTKFLPKEYGGEIPMADMIAQYKEELKSARPYLEALDTLEIDLTGNKKKFLPDLDDDLSGVAGSFRKLEVD